MFYLLTNCSIIIASLLSPLDVADDKRYDERLAVCQILVEEAKKTDVPIDLTLAVAWQESRMTDAGTNSSGCSGPMQIKVKYWCPNKEGEWSPYRADGVIEDCDLYNRGVFVLAYYLRRFKNTKSALCAYGWGNCTNEGMSKYVYKTLKYRKIIQKLLNSY